MDSVRRYQNHGVHVYARQLIKYFQDAAAQNSIIFKPFVCSGSDNVANRLILASALSRANRHFCKHDRLWRIGGASYAATAGPPGRDLQSALPHHVCR